MQISAMAGVIRTSSCGLRQDVTRYHARCRRGALGERQMSVNFTCRPTIAAARLRLESKGL